jgi:predicted metalloprotease
VIVINSWTWAARASGSGGGGGIVDVVVVAMVLVVVVGAMVVVVVTLGADVVGMAVVDVVVGTPALRHEANTSVDSNPSTTRPRHDALPVNRSPT